MKPYTKVQLEELVLVQLDNINAINELVSIIKVQNELLHKVNNKLMSEISGIRESAIYPKGKRRRQPA